MRFPGLARRRLQIRLAGTIRQAKTFGECLVLHREITTQLGANALVVRDVVENAGVRPEPMMLLYHCNFGYPIVNADSRVYTSGGSVEPRDPTPLEAVADHDRLGEPQAGYVEQCFYHDLKAKDGRAFAAIYNEQLGVGGYVRYRVENLRSSCNGRCSASRSTSSVWNRRLTAWTGEPS